MHKIKIAEKVPFSAKEMYSLVADIEKYPEFIDWCDDLKILEVNKNFVLAKMNLSFLTYSETVATKVFFDEAKLTISVENAGKNFEFLNNYWRFVSINKNSTLVFFKINFKIKSRILNILLNKFMNRVSKKMVKVFLDRAKELKNR